MRRVRPVLWIFVLGFAVGGCATGGRLLGERTVAFTADRDVIRVGADQGRFRAIQIHVSDSPIEMYDVRIRFGDGSVHSPSTRLRFEQGAWTRRIDFPGGARVVRTIEFRYRSTGPRSGRARVQAIGLR